MVFLNEHQVLDGGGPFMGYDVFLTVSRGHDVIYTARLVLTLSNDVLVVVLIATHRSIHHQRDLKSF